jgi:phytol kinase
VVPLLATAAGGVLAALLFGPFASVGFLVAGWGDAVAEPIGIRYGRHRYRVPGLAGIVSHRSLEGSAAVLVASSVAAAAALALLGLRGGELALCAAAVAATAAAVEAASPHGLDNLTIQLVASGVAFALAR